MRIALVFLLAAVFFIHFVGDATPSWKRVYRIGDIPAQEVAPGEVLEIPICDDGTGQSDKLVKIKHVSPKTDGLITIRDSCILTFKPTRQDLKAFKVGVELYAGGKEPQSQEFTISVRDFTSLEYLIFSPPGQRPSPTSDSYISIYEVSDPYPKLFNGVKDRLTKSILISGFEVQLAKDGGDNKIYQTYIVNGPRDIANFTIVADSVWINDPLILPGTIIRVYAKSLKIGPHGYIDTTPSDWEYTPAAATVDKDAEDGLDGQTAGRVELYVKELTIAKAEDNERLKKPFTAHGGKGQVPGRGLAGAAGSTMGYWQYRSLPDEKIVFHHTENPRGNPDHGVRAWPSDGQPGKPAGEPGLGGDGGDVLSTVFIDSEEIDLAGGPSAPKGEDVEGGPPGQPENAVWTYIDCHEPYYFCLPAVEQRHTSVRGAPGIAPKARKSRGSRGAYRLNYDARHQWLRHENLQTAVLYAKDLFLNGLSSDAKNVLSPYVEDWPFARNEAIDGYQSVRVINPGDDIQIGRFHIQGRIQELNADRSPYNDVVFRIISSPQNSGQTLPLLIPYANALKEYPRSSDEVRGELERLQRRLAVLDSSLKRQRNDYSGYLPEEAKSIISRIEKGVDFYGNPPGWAPFYSLEYSVQAFETSVRDDIDMLYFAQSLKEVHQSSQNRINDIQNTLDSIRRDVDRLHANQVALAQSYDDLVIQLTELTQKEELLEKQVKVRSEELRAAAGFEMKRQVIEAEAKRDIATFSMIMKSIPTPYTVAFGIAVDLANGASVQNVMAENTSYISTINHSSIKEVAAELRATLGDLNPSKLRTPDGRVAFKKALNDVSAKMAKVSNDLRNIEEKHRVPANAFEMALQRLRAEDGHLSVLYEELARYSSKKQAAATALSRITHLAEETVSGLDADWRTYDSLHKELRGEGATNDLYVQQLVNDLGQRALARLMQYEYFLKKAYEHRFLQPYPSSLAFVSTLPRAIRGQKLEQIRSIYTQTLSTLTETILMQTQSMGLQHSTAYEVPLTDEEIGKLNMGEEASVDIGWRIPLFRGEENRRIESIELVSTDGEIVGTGQGSTASGKFKLRYVPGMVIYDGKPYMFTYPQDLTWFAHLNIDKGGQKLVNDVISVQSLSLLRYMLGNNYSQDDASLLAFYQPSLEGALMVSFEPSVKRNIRLKQAAVRIKYAYSSTKSIRPLLKVGTKGCLKPYVRLDRNDELQRSDGLAPFVRIFSSPDSITLRAPSSCQGALLHIVEVDGSPIVDSLDKISLHMDQNHSVQFIYGPSAMPH